MTLQLLLSAFLSLAYAQGGHAVSCGCYCNLTLPPPCSDSACISACQGRSSSYSSGESPMAGVPMGKWTKALVGRWKENVSNCGGNPLCMLGNTAASAIVIPLFGLIPDTPVFIAKGVVNGFYYAGKGVAAVGRGVAAPFKTKPKPVVPVYDCAAVSREQDELFAAQAADRQAFNDAVVRYHADKVQAAAKDAVLENVPGGQEADALRGDVDLAKALSDFHDETRRCVRSGAGDAPFRGCVDAASDLLDALLDKALDASRIAAAREALRGYTATLVEKTLPLVSKAAACNGR